MDTGLSPDHDGLAFYALFLGSVEVGNVGGAHRQDHPVVVSTEQPFASGTTHGDGQDVAVGVRPMPEAGKPS